MIFGEGFQAAFKRRQADNILRLDNADSLERHNVRKAMAQADRGGSATSRMRVWQEILLRRSNGK